MNRREFIGGIAAATALDLWAVPGSERPYLRVGLFTDTHIKRTPESFKLTAAAFKLFKAQGVDAIAHCGDLADLHYDEAYAMYRKGLAETFGDKMPTLIYSYADHDVLNPDWDIKKRVAPPHFDVKWAYGDMRKKLGIDHDFFAEKDICGLHFITISEQIKKLGGYALLRERLAAACKANPGKPVILLSHKPPAGTTVQSDPDGHVELREILNDFPQVICFHGHTHIPVVNETNIWQGEFTTVNCGCLYEWHGRGVASPFVGNRSYWVSVADFYRDRMIVRRYDVRTGEEVRADARWCVPLPFVARTAPYAYENAKRREAKVGYPQGAALKVVHLAAPRNIVRVWVPDSQDEAKIAVHRLRAYERVGKEWREIALQDRLSEYHLVPDGKKGGIWIEIADGYFEPGKTYRITATPVGFRDTEGEPIGVEWTAPAAIQRPQPVWSSDNPAVDLVAKIGKKAVHPSPDGWFEMPDGKKLVLELPREIWDVPIGTKLRFDFTVDAEQFQSGKLGITLNLTPANGYWRKAAIARLLLPSGKAEGFRYVKAFKSPGVKFAHNMVFSGRYGGRIRVRSVKLERYAGK